MKGEGIATKTVGGKFAIDSFLQGAFSVDMNQELGGIRTFENHDAFKHLHRLLKPSMSQVLLALGRSENFKKK